MICVDASLVLAFLLPEEDFTVQASSLFARWRETQETMIAPALLAFEVLSSIRLAVYSSRIDADTGDGSFAVFRQMPIEIRNPEGLWDRCWDIGKAMNTPRLYDASYLALGDIEGCDVWSADRRFVRFEGERSPRLRWVGDV
jgi:predicted nucleic acid-binding protein